jgi:hypothetical protein
MQLKLRLDIWKKENTSSEKGVPVSLKNLLRPRGHVEWKNFVSI